MRRFFNSLSFKIGGVLIVAEIIILAVVSVIYADHFSDQIDQRVKDRIRLPGELVNSSLVRLISIRDADSLRMLVGEDITNALLIDSEQGRVVFSLHNDYVGARIEDIPELDSDWFDTEIPKETLLNTTEGDDTFMVGVTPLRSASEKPGLFLYIKTSTNETNAEKAYLTHLLVWGSAGTILATFLVIFLSFRLLIFRRVTDALETLKRIEEGELSARIDHATSLDEIGFLQRSVNSMANKREQAECTLTRWNEALEERVASRTRDFEVAANVSTQITTVLDLGLLLPRIVELTRQSFDLYHVGIFLYNPMEASLDLVAATGEIAQSLLNEGIAPHLSDEVGLVACAARQRQAVVSNNVTTTTNYRPHPLLPGTQSEAAFPMTIGSELIGILDLQADQTDHFSRDDIRVLGTLAEQIAVAVRNAQSYTQVEIARQEAEQANQLKSMFLASVSHELRTPLNAIINFSKLMLRGLMGSINKEQSESLGKIARSGTQLLNLINDVLDISKIEAGALELYVEEDVDLTDELRAVYSTAEGLIADKPIELVLDISNPLPLVTVDRQRVFQILMNLVSNACRYTEEGRIVISSYVRDGNVVFSVQDTGPGIAPEDQELIFEAFRQSKTGLRRGTGTGLGLTIAKHLAAVHEGSLWVESLLGAGSTFFVSIPIHSHLKPTIATKEGETQE